MTTLTGPRSTSRTVPKLHILALQSPGLPPTTLVGRDMVRYFLTRPLWRQRLSSVSRSLTCRLLPLPAADLPDRVGRLWAAFDIEVEASLDASFESGVVTETFRTLDPDIQGMWGRPSQTSLEIHGGLSSVGGTPIAIHYRYCQESSTTWVTGSMTIQWRNQLSYEVPIVTGLTPYTLYVIELSRDPTFPPTKQPPAPSGLCPCLRISCAWAFGR